MSVFENACFELSVAHTATLPPSRGAEIVFAGRSNAGKSSAINTLVGHNRLAFVSKTPGRTQLINFFRLPGGAALVDLPGYGYAKAPEAVRRKWQGLLERYLTTRSNIIGMVLIMDARHPLKALDEQMINWFLSVGKPIHILLSKSDKLSRGAAAATLQGVRQYARKLDAAVSVQLFSSLHKSGVEEVDACVSAWLQACEIADQDGHNKE